MALKDGELYGGQVGPFWAQEPDVFGLSLLPLRAGLTGTLFLREAYLWRGLACICIQKGCSQFGVMGEVGVVTP